MPIAIGQKLESDFRDPLGLLNDYHRRILISLLKDLRTTYEKHLAVEDNELFPLAGRILDRAELDAIAREMAARRGLVVSRSTSQ